MDGQIQPAANAKTAVSRKSPKIGKSIRRSVIPHVLLCGVGLLFLVPFVWLVLTSLKSDEEIFSLSVNWFPSEFLWSNYAEAVKAIPFLRYTLNTLMLSGLSILGQLLSSPLVAYGLSRIHFKGRNVLFFIMMGTMILPYQVTMVPVYIMFNKLEMVDSYIPLILPNFFGSAFYIFLLRQFFMNIPWELSESAKMDGASEFRIFLKMILPLSKPVIYTVALFTFLHAWGDFLGPLLYLNSPEKWTLSIGLRAFIGENKVDWGLLMAASTIFTVPIIVLYFFVQRTFIQGITMTGFK